MNTPRIGTACAALFALPLLVSSLSAQVTCTANVGAPTILRVSGDTEPLGDYTVSCTGGVPTPAGSLVPQVNFSLFLNTNLTSKVTAGLQFSEALLVVDEPNSPVNPTRPILNCGQTGAPDTGPSGPGVCSIISTGVPANTYDGTPNGFGVVGACGVSAYGCGRPNVFQAQLNPSQFNVVTFFGVPFDPPGAGTRTFRFTNLRANAALLGLSPGPLANPVKATLSIAGPLSLSLSSPVQNAGFILPDFAPVGVPAVDPTGTIATVHIQKPFAGAWRAKNLSFTVGDNLAVLGNATFNGFFYDYNGNTNYPADIAQNVPSALYYTSESMFEWSNLFPNGSPPVDPPPGFAVVPVAGLGGPLGSATTGIASAGSVNAGTRIALTFTKPGKGAFSLSVPPVIYLHRAGMPPTSPATGVMVLTSTDSSGAGPFTPTTGSSVPSGHLAVYEVLYADPFSIEYADIPCTLTSGGGGAIKFAVSYAPFYTGAGAGQPTPNPVNATPTAVPRFEPPDSGTFQKLFK